MCVLRRVSKKHHTSRHKRAGCVSVTAETNPERNDTLIVIAKRGGLSQCENSLFHDHSKRGFARLQATVKALSSSTTQRTSLSRSSVSPSFTGRESTWTHIRAARTRPSTTTWHKRHALKTRTHRPRRALFTTPGAHGARGIHWAGWHSSKMRVAKGIQTIARYWCWSLRPQVRVYVYTLRFAKT